MRRRPVLYAEPWERGWGENCAGSVASEVTPRQGLTPLGDPNAINGAAHGVKARLLPILGARGSAPAAAWEGMKSPRN